MTLTWSIKTLDKEKEKTIIKKKNAHKQAKKGKYGREVKRHGGQNEKI